MISAVSVNGVIGKTDQNGKPILPFDYSEDLKHFKNITLNSVVVMGRRTWEGIGRPLPSRENIVITKSKLNIPGIKCMKSIPDVLRHYDYIGSPSIWFIGGRQIYEEGMYWADLIILTLTPDVIKGDGLVSFPFINPSKFRLETIEPMETDTRLQIATYHRKR